jgi:uncharacterized membrane protein
MGPDTDADRDTRFWRLDTFSDAIFAVAMTLLVLDLKLPTSGDLPQQLRQMLPKVLIYLLVFASVAGYWNIHYRTFRLIRRGDVRLVLFSLTNLLFVTLFPVAASITGAHPLEPLATVCLSANSLLYCLTAWGVWSHAAVSPHLLAEGADKARLQSIDRIMLLVAVSLALAIPLAFLSVYIAYAIWIVSAPFSAWWVHRNKKG